MASGRPQLWAPVSGETRRFKETSTLRTCGTTPESGIRPPELGCLPTKKSGENNRGEDQDGGYRFHWSGHHGASDGGPLASRGPSIVRVQSPVRAGLIIGKWHDGLRIQRRGGPKSSDHYHHASGHPRCRGSAIWCQGHRRGTDVGKDRRGYELDLSY